MQNIEKIEYIHLHSYKLKTLSDKKKIHSHQKEHYSLPYH